MEYFVTGATGFVGGALVEQLLETTRELRIEHRPIEDGLAGTLQAAR